MYLTFAGVRLGWEWRRFWWLLRLVGTIFAFEAAAFFALWPFISVALDALKR